MDPGPTGAEAWSGATRGGPSAVTCGRGFAVQAEQAARPPEWCLDDIELVQVAAGAWPGERRDVGVRMTWHQGPSRFGLLISWDRLVRQSGSSAAVPSYLDLAIDEPHAAGLDSTVLWFLDLPSGLH